MYSGLPETFQHEEPTCEIRIEQNILPRHLYKKAGVSDEGQPKLSVGCELWLVGFSGSWRDGRISYQFPKSLRPLSHGGVLQRIAQPRLGSFTFHARRIATAVGALSAISAIVISNSRTQSLRLLDAHPALGSNREEEEEFLRCV